MVDKRMFVWFRVSVLAAIIGMGFTIDIYRRPYGTKMCRDLCYQTGCTSSIYSDLSCHIADIGTVDNENGNVPERFFQVRRFLYLNTHV